VGEPGLAFGGRARLVGEVQQLRDEPVGVGDREPARGEPVVELGGTQRGFQRLPERAVVVGEEKRHRINRRELVMRNLLALSAGVRLTTCWNLAPDIPGYSNPLSVMDLLFGKFALLGYRGTELSERHPAAETFALLADQLAGVDGVTRLEVPGRPGLLLFDVRRRGRGPLLAVWEQRDPFDGEDEPPVAFDWPWPAARAAAVDALGQAQAAEVRDGRVRLEVSLTPVFVAAD
jgi:hypothetical protein